MSKTNETTDTQPQQPVSLLQSFTNLGMFASKDDHLTQRCQGAVPRS